MSVRNTAARIDERDGHLGYHAEWAIRHAYWWENETGLITSE